MSEVLASIGEVEVKRTGLRTPQDNPQRPGTHRFVNRLEIRAAGSSQSVVFYPEETKNGLIAEAQVLPSETFRLTGREYTLPDIHHFGLDPRQQSELSLGAFSDGEGDHPLLIARFLGHPDRIATEDFFRRPYSPDETHTYQQGRFSVQENYRMLAAHSPAIKVGRVRNWKEITMEDQWDSFEAEVMFIIELAYRSIASRDLYATFGIAARAEADGLTRIHYGGNVFVSASQNLESAWPSIEALADVSCFTRDLVSGHSSADLRQTGLPVNWILHLFQAHLMDNRDGNNGRQFAAVAAALRKELISIGPKEFREGQSSRSEEQKRLTGVIATMTEAIKIAA